MLNQLTIIAARDELRPNGVVAHACDIFIHATHRRTFQVSKLR